MSILGYIKDIFVNPDKYAKFWIAIVGTVAQLLNIYFPTAEWVPVVFGLLTSLGVFTVPNKK